MPEDVIFRLSPGGGPPPETEILFHAQRAQEYGQTWVGLRRARNPDRIRYGSSRLYLITSLARSRKTVLRGIVREVTTSRPHDELLGDLYRNHDFPAWWRIDGVECVRTDFDALRLRMTDGKPYDLRWLSIRQPFNYLAQVGAWPTNAVDAADVAVHEESDNVASDLVEPLILDDEPDLLTFESTIVPPSEDSVSIHAVDWSGGGGPTQANPKIRYACLHLADAAATVVVSPPTLSRSRILQMIRTTPGLWVVDFPFGLPLELIRRAGVTPNTLDATLAFTQSVPKEHFRDHCKAVWSRSAQKASKRRATERAVGCGWFDWFVQLFRQTWTGQVEVLRQLRASNPEVAILPWDYDKGAVTRLVEGFPAASLRHRGISVMGYKRATRAGQDARAEIIDGLVARGLPLTPAIRDEAVSDNEGDLIDALVMLLAGRDALTTDHSAIRAELERRGLLGEGWIYR